MRLGVSTQTAATSSSEPLGEPRDIRGAVDRRHEREVEVHRTKSRTLESFAGSTSLATRMRRRPVIRPAIESAVAVAW